MSNEIRTPRKYRAMSPLTVRLTMIGLVVFIACVYVYFRGNPVTKFKIDKHADAYIEENYPEIAQQVEKTSQGAYYTSFGYYEIQGADVTPHIEKGWGVYYYFKDDYSMNFALRYDKKANLIFDGCKEYYQKGGSIYEHLSGEYREFIVKTKNDEYYDGRGAVGISPAGLRRDIEAEAWFDNSVSAFKAIDDMAYNGPVLDITKEYTLEELANRYGIIDFSFREDNVGDMEALYNRCIEVRNFIEKYNLPFAKVNVGTAMFQGSYGITKEELYGDNLKQVIQDKYQDIYSE